MPPEPRTPEEWAFHLQSKLDDNSDLPREREMFKKCVHAIRAQAFREMLSNNAQLQQQLAAIKVQHEVDLLVNAELKKELQRLANEWKQDVSKLEDERFVFKARVERAETLAALREASEDTAITRLGKVEKELTKHKLSIQIAEDNYAKLQKAEKELAEAKQWVEELKASESAELAKLRSDVKPLLDLLLSDGEEEAKTFLSAHPEFRKDETK